MGAQIELKSERVGTKGFKNRCQKFMSFLRRPGDSMESFGVDLCCLRQYTRSGPKKIVCFAKVRVHTVIENSEKMESQGEQKCAKWYQKGTKWNQMEPKGDQMKLKGSQKATKMYPKVDVWSWSRKGRLFWLSAEPFW